MWQDVDNDPHSDLTEVPFEQILALQQVKLDEQKREHDLRRRAMARRGLKLLPVSEDAY